MGVEGSWPQQGALAAIALVLTLAVLAPRLGRIASTGVTAWANGATTIIDDTEEHDQVLAALISHRHKLGRAVVLKFRVIQCAIGFLIAAVVLATGGVVGDLFW